MNLLQRLALSVALGCAILVAMSQTSAQAADAGVYRHVVLFKFKDSASAEQVKSVEAAFRKLATQVDTITGYEWGTNVSPENKNEGFTHCFLVTFKDKAGLDVYLPHPAHDAFKAVLIPHLDKVLVIDYVSAK
ncbi:MAG: Stress responsive alpha-beta barrel protein [Devosia sp.]|uniref:Dabb family protein n=1 Tax=Devosia sp. TaxID=1871048 RepID=UPI00263377C6|nr:Dabb family protein [Devosia sp.]MDB5531629.1 Stress responsive alpha-beta barrel protein [Devosia sp.]